MGDPLPEVHFGSWSAAEGPVPVVPDPYVDVPGVEVLKVLVERHKVLQRGSREDEGILSTRFLEEVISQFHIL